MWVVCGGERVFVSLKPVPLSQGLCRLIALSLKHFSVSSLSLPIFSHLSLSLSLLTSLSLYDMLTPLSLKVHDGKPKALAGWLEKKGHAKMGMGESWQRRYLKVDELGHALTYAKSSE